MSVKEEVVKKTKQKNKQSFPKMYKVVLHNDNYTPMDFVVAVLQKIFDRPFEEANAVMMQIHNDGKGVAGIYSKEVAKTKQFLTLENAKKYEHPLKCTIELIDE